VALVAVDAIARLDERRRRDPPSDTDTERDRNVTSTQKIVVDLSKRK